MDRTPINQVPVLNFRDFISADGEVLTTDSLKVAQVHKKRHSDVLRLIRQRMSEAGEWGERNFALSFYRSAQGKDIAVVNVTRDGYTFIVGKLTGKLAVQHQIAFIEAFNAMAAYIKNQRDGLRYRCMEKELECKDSFRRGSVHGRGLNQRKQEKPVLEAQLSALLDEVQHPLPLKATE